MIRSIETSGASRTTVCRSAWFKRAGGIVALGIVALIAAIRLANAALDRPSRRAAIEGAIAAADRALIRLADAALDGPVRRAAVPGAMRPVVVAFVIIRRRGVVAGWRRRIIARRWRRRRRRVIILRARQQRAAKNQQRDPGLAAGFEDCLHDLAFSLGADPRKACPRTDSRPRTALPIGHAQMNRRRRRRRAVSCLDYASPQRPGRNTTAAAGADKAAGGGCPDHAAASLRGFLAQLRLSLIGHLFPGAGHQEGRLLVFRVGKLGGELSAGTRKLAVFGNGFHAGSSLAARLAEARELVCIF